MNSNELGDLYEKVAIETLRKLGYQDLVIVHTFYDIEATRESEKYYFEVKGRKSKRTPFISTQIRALNELKLTGKSVYWIFITLATKGKNIYVQYSIEPY